jgi:uncharacterized coiled-coil protein SlyX
MSLRAQVSKDFPDRSSFNAAVVDGVEEELAPVKQDVQELQVEQAAQKATLTTLTTQVTALNAAVSAITSALAILRTAIAKAQAAADKAQATADSKPGGEGSGGYTLIVKWTTPSGSGITGPINTSVSSGGRNVSKQLTSAQSSSLSGLSSGSVVTFAVDIGPDNTVQWKDESNEDNPNLTGRSNFYKTYSGFKVPATTGTKTIIADIG